MPLPHDHKRKRRRGEAYLGKGYGTQRYELFVHAKEHIERCIASGYDCEAIAVIESVITDRLESRLSHLEHDNVGFETLGRLLRRLRRVEPDGELRAILDRLDEWRKARNGAIHELVKVEEEEPHKTWEQRLLEMHSTATGGYELLKALYNRVADLNPYHPDRVFPPP